MPQALVARGDASLAALPSTNGVRDLFQNVLASFCVTRHSVLLCGCGQNTDSKTERRTPVLVIQEVVRAVRGK
jgi:hypothetical protein